MIRFIYIIGVTENPVKIGIARNLRSRLTTLQIGCPDPLVLHYSKSIPHNAAEDLETAVHRRLKPKHRRGEWFDVSVEEAREAIEALAPRVDDQVLRRAARGDLLSRIMVQEDLGHVVIDAIGNYRSMMNDPTRRRELEVTNSVILHHCGVAGLAAFQTMIIQHNPLSTGFYRDPALVRRAEAALAKAIRVLCLHYRRLLPLDQITEKAA